MEVSFARDFALMATLAGCEMAGSRSNTGRGIIVLGVNNNANAYHAQIVMFFIIYPSKEKKYLR